jgi:RNA polymerase sigma-70 factor (ECF subfamily)
LDAAALGFLRTNISVKESARSSVESSMSLLARHASEHALLRRARRGHSDAFAELVRRHDEALRALAYRLLGERAAMDDALQDAYIRAYRSLASFEGRSGFGTWLYRIAYRSCIDELRRRGRNDWSPLDDSDLVAPEPALDAAGRLDLADALAALPVELRASVLLVDAQGFSYDEAAGILGVPAGTVASRLNRARAVLRAGLDTAVAGGAR